MILSAFRPAYFSGNLIASTTIAAVGTAANVTLPTNAANSPDLLISNVSTLWAYINFGPAAVTAVTIASGLPIAPGSQQIIKVDPDVTTASVMLTAAGPGNVTFTRGEGM